MPLLGLSCEVAVASLFVEAGGEESVGDDAAEVASSWRDDEASLVVRDPRPGPRVLGAPAGGEAGCVVVGLVSAGGVSVAELDVGKPVASLDSRVFHPPLPAAGAAGCVWAICK